VRALKPLDTLLQWSEVLSKRFPQLVVARDDSSLRDGINDLIQRNDGMLDGRPVHMRLIGSGSDEE
jgi:hypothetical protein